MGGHNAVEEVPSQVRDAHKRGAKFIVSQFLEVKAELLRTQALGNDAESDSIAAVLTAGIWANNDS